jgi:hypothetical protein
LDIATFRPGNTVWYILPSSDQGVDYRGFGLATDVPMVGRLTKQRDRDTESGLKKGFRWFTKAAGAFFADG